jgi:4,5-DOPA dioxygenase extradiol
MFPEADLPVLQLAIDATKPLADHVALGRRLAPLRERGVLILGSGNVVHHLGRLDFALEHEGFDWAHAFDDEAQRLMTTDPGAITSLGEHPAYRLAAPTPDHFIPLLYIAGLASASTTTASVIAKGYALGSLSMTAYRVG